MSLYLKSYTGYDMFRWILLRVKNISDKCFREDQNTRFRFENFFPESRVV